jgi:hopene-associated glycosyltransferase HpnB
MTWLLWPLALGWAGYALFGRRWRISPRLESAPALTGASVVAVVPARNEAAELPQTLDALLGQHHPVRVVLVDDHSEDGTADVARAVAAAAGAADRLTVLASAPLPPGWTGKVWAQHQGVAHAARLGAEWVWLTDADIRHDAGVLERLLATAEHGARDLVSVMARLRCVTGFEKLLVPAFTYFFAMLYPFPAIRRDRARAAGAAGGCVLVRRRLLERAGGLEAIRTAVIDDCALARVCKDAGGRLWLGYDAGVRSTRSYPTLGALWNMVARSAYTQLRTSPWILAGCVLGLAWTFLLPVAALLAPSPAGRVLGLVAWGAMVRTYVPMVRWLGVPVGWALLLPVAAVLYTGMTVTSAWRHHRGHGAAWKGRAYGPAATVAEARGSAPAEAGPEPALLRTGEMP